MSLFIRTKAKLTALFRLLIEITREVLTTASGHMLTAANAGIQARLDHGGYADPSPDRPCFLITIDECQHVFAGNPEATALAERIVTNGGPAGLRPRREQPRR
jgi:hypothetical protein